MAPSLLHILEGHVGRHLGSNEPDGGGHLRLVTQITPPEPEHAEEPINVDPGRERVVETQPELVLLTRHRQAFHQPLATVHAGQSAPAILDSPRNHLVCQARGAGDVPAQQGGIEVGSDGVDVVEEQPAEIRPLGQERPQHAIAQHVGDLVPMPYGVKALEREVVGVVASFAGRLRPGEQRRMQAVAYLLLLLVEHLMREFLPREPQITGHRHHPEPHGTARREHDRQVGHVPTGDRRRDLLVRQVARGGNVRHRHTGHPAGRPRLRKVHLQKRSVPAPKPAEGVQGFDDTRPLRPAAAHAGGEGHNGRFAAGKGREACLPKRRLVARS